MESLEFLIKVLKCSVKKNEEIPLTNRHLLNIVRMALKWKDKDYEISHLQDEIFLQQMED